MATAAGIYEALWEPKKIGIDKPRDLISVLEKGLDELKNNPTHYKKFDSKNGWGVYEDFVKFVEKILCACYLYPNEFLNVSI